MVLPDAVVRVPERGIGAVLARLARRGGRGAERRLALGRSRGGGLGVAGEGILRGGGGEEEEGRGGGGGGEVAVGERERERERGG